MLTIRGQMAIIAIVAVLGCKQEFPTQHALPVELEALNWNDQDTILVGDTLLLQTKVTSDGRVVAGVSATWQSSNEAVVGLVRPATASNAQHNMTQDMTTIARSTGVADIIVTVEAPGFVEQQRLAQRLIVRERWVSISAGVNHSCAVSIEHDAYCWGGGLNLLGNGSSLGSFIPVRVLGSIPFASVAAGWEHSCGLASDGLAYCWGHNPWGAVGNGTTQDQLAPVQLQRGPRLSGLSAGVGFTCGVMSDVSYGLCWGDNSSGQATVSDADRCPQQQKVCARSWGLVTDSLTVPYAFTQISTGERHSCGLLLDGTAMCWGDNTRGLLGDTGSAPALLPRRVSTTERFRSIAAGGFHTCGLTKAGVALCWGTNAYGELGNNEQRAICDGTACVREPVAVQTSLRFTAISAGAHTTCALTAAKEAYCWGLGDAGQLGSTTALSLCGVLPCARAAVRVGAGVTFLAISVGATHVCAIRDEGLAHGATQAPPGGGAFCWGGNVGGKLGVGTTINSSVPKRITDPAR